jgi:hypothetical protein
MKFTKCVKHKMNRKQSQNRTTVLRDWLELFYEQAVLPEQDDTILLPTIKNSDAVFALNSATCSSILLRLATLFTSHHSLAVWREAVWHEAACNSIGRDFVRFAPFPH